MDGIAAKRKCIFLGWKFADIVNIKTHTSDATRKEYIPYILDQNYLTYKERELELRENWLWELNLKLATDIKWRCVSMKQSWIYFIIQF